jgi:PAS domain S-box-containing protein
MYYVISGEAHMGNQVLRAGDSFFVPADAPYVYTAGPDGVEVLEIRHNVAQFDMKIPRRPRRPVAGDGRDQRRQPRALGIRGDEPHLRGKSGIKGQGADSRRTWIVPSPVVDLRPAWMVAEGRSTTSPGVWGRRGEKEPIDVPEAELFAALVESADDAIVTTTLDGRILTWNRGAERLYGYAEVDVVGQPSSFLLPEDGRDEIAEVIQRIVQRARVEHYESVACTRRGRRVDVSISVSPVFDGDRLVAIASIARDISGRKHVERMINHLAFHDGLTGSPTAP